MKQNFAVLITSLYSIICLNAQTNPTSPTAVSKSLRASCNNLDFTAGNTSNWKGKWCKDPGGKGDNYAITPATSLPTTGFNSSTSSNQNDFVHEIMIKATDPYAPISTVPPGHTNSMRLGSDEATKAGLGAFPYNHQMISNTFTVSDANPTITYWYAIVLENKTGFLAHDQTDQPYFRIKLFDEAGKPIACANYDVDATAGIKAGFQTITSKGKMIVYKDWVPIYIPLIDYKGKQITIQFESSDCSQGGHFGYAYVAVDCNPFKVITTTPVICGNNNVILTAPPGANSYLWTGPGVPAAPANKNQAIAVNTPGKYTVEMTVLGNNGATCTFKLDTTIGGAANFPIALFSAPSVCVGQPTVFTDQSTPTGSITSWSWDFNNDGVEDSNQQNPTYTYTTIGTYPVKLKIMQGVCPGEVTQNVIVTSIATANAGSPQSVCIGTPITLNGTIGGAATIGTWSGGNGTYTPSNTNLQAIYAPTQAEYDAGTVRLTLTTDDPAGACTFASSDVVLNFYNNPVINFVVDKPKGCAPHCVKFTDSTTVGGDKITSWAWDFGDKTAQGSTQNPFHCYVNPGFYDVTLTATSSHGCMSSLTKPKMIEVFSNPIAEFTAFPNPLPIMNPKVQLTNQSSADVVYWHYSFGDGDTVAPSTSSPKHLYPKEKAKSYWATLIVKNAGGCMDTVVHEIKVLPEFTFFIPNAFTPDKNGINDLFFGEGVGIEKYNFWIFDRWGNLIFHTEDLSEGWNGKIKNDEIALQDVYVWKVKITDVFNKVHDYIGTVTLVK